MLHSFNIPHAGHGMIVSYSYVVFKTHIIICCKYEGNMLFSIHTILTTLYHTHPSIFEKVVPLRYATFQSSIYHSGEALYVTFMLINLCFQNEGLINYVNSFISGMKTII